MKKKFPSPPKHFFSVALAAVLIIGTFLRFYRFTSTLQFLGDQGRDALVVLHIIRDHHPVLIGPVTSTGNMYLGPLYYYFMVPFLMLTYPSPLGPAYFVAVLSIITIFLIYWLGKDLVGERAALIGAAAYAVSATAITYARFSWNPNPAPFFAIILLWASQKVLQQKYWYFVVISLCVAVLVQLHYVTLLGGAAASILWLIELVRLIRSPIKRAVYLKTFILSTLIAGGLFLFSLLPLVLFDFRHQFLNLHSLQKLLTTEDGGFSRANNTEKVLRVVTDMHGRSLLILFEMFIGLWRPMNTLLLVVFILLFTYLLLNKRQEKYRTGYFLLVLYVLVATFGLSFYKSSVFFHYIAYLFPVSLLAYGVFLEKMYELKYQFGKIIAVCFAAGFLYWNATHLPLKPLSWTIDDISRTTQTITARVKPGEKYNIVLLTGTGDIEGQNYRYFLETTDKPPLPKEQWGETETLFIINEDMKLKRVVDSPIYEIVVFPHKTPSEVYKMPGGPEITVLRKR